MSVYTPVMLEITVMFLIWATATLSTSRYRRRLNTHYEGPPPLGAALRNIPAHVSRPVLVLLMTRLLLVLADTWHPTMIWIQDHQTHLVAWQVFWLGLGGLALLEGCLHALFSWRQRAFPVPDLLLDIIRGVLVAALALLVLRVELGFDIGPLLASTALVTAVAGFALQGVLGNLMAGMSLHLVRTLQPGVWVEVDGVEGRIVRTNWRETRIRTRGGHLYIIPNANIAASKIHNYAEPTPLRRHVVNVGASYSDAPDEVMAAMEEAARAVPEVRTTPAPEAMITEFQDYGINYRLEFWTTELHRHNPIDGAVNRMIWYQFKRRGIEIPFPMSDKLLNDFMAVVYNQRRLPPLEEDLTRTVDDLLASELCTRLLTDDQGELMLDRDDLARIAPLVRRLPFTEGETLCAQGDAGEIFWIIAAGKLRGKVEKDGHIAAEFELGPGAIVGEMSTLTCLPRSATLTTTTGTELLEFGPEAFKALLELHPDIPEKLAALAAERAAENMAALEELARNMENKQEVVLEKRGILGRLKRIMGRVG